MSYILEAIKKAEQQRNRGQMPTLHSMGGYNDGGSGRSVSRIAGIAGIGLLLVAIVWFHRPILESLGAGLSAVTTRVADMFAGQQSVGNTTSPASSSVPAQSAADEDTLGKIQFSVISYSSDPNKRFVMDGSRILREGDLIHDFPIREIRKDSVVLDVNGQERIVQY